MEKCNICGKEDSGNNYTWSEEWVCDACVSWIEKNNLVHILDTREREREFIDFWAAFCHREKFEFDTFQKGIEMAQKDIDYWYNNNLWKLIDSIKNYSA